MESCRLALVVDGPIVWPVPTTNEADDQAGAEDVLKAAEDRVNRMRG
jgi:hypothetical protein